MSEDTSQELKTYLLEKGMTLEKLGAETLKKEFGLKDLEITGSIEFSSNDEDKKAAWELYIELATRITTQELPDKDGDEKTALDSVYSLFPNTREISKKYGPDCINFTNVTFTILNQWIRPFTAKWHKKLIQGAFAHANDEHEKNCSEFRKELKELREILLIFKNIMANMAGLEGKTAL